MVDRCAISVVVIGNELGRLDKSLQQNESMANVHRARDSIAHIYGTHEYRNEILWRDIREGIEDIKRGCQAALEAIEDPNNEFVFNDNLRRKARRWRIPHRKRHRDSDPDPREARPEERICWEIQDPFCIVR